MKVHFYKPPPAQRAGGLNAAIEALRRALLDAGIEVSAEMPTKSGRSVVHFHGLWQFSHARLAAGFASEGIPCVISPHGMLELWALNHKRWKKEPYYHTVEKRHLRRAKAVLATAPKEAKRLRELLPDVRVEVLPLGLTGETRPDYEAARAHLGWAPEERVLLFLSRIHVKKGLDLLFHALAETTLPERTRLVIVGGGSPTYEAELRALAARLGDRLPRIDWIGELWTEARWKYFQGADLFCLPSHSENFGLAVLEACQVGTPVLTTTTTPWADEIGSDQGYIAEPTVESLHPQLTRFFAAGPWLPEDRVALAAWAWGKFHWSALTPRYLDLYRGLLGAI